MCLWEVLLFQMLGHFHQAHLSLSIYLSLSLSLSLSGCCVHTLVHRKWRGKGVSFILYSFSSCLSLPCLSQRMMIPAANGDRHFQFSTASLKRGGLECLHQSASSDDQKVTVHVASPSPLLTSLSPASLVGPS